jgi:hypothetical protein
MLESLQPRADKLVNVTTTEMCEPALSGCSAPCGC